MLQQGLQIMLVGITGVFAFLILMVLTMDIAAAIVKKLDKYFPETPEEKGPKAKSDQNQEIAVAIAAVQAHANLK